MKTFGTLFLVGGKSASTEPPFSISRSDSSFSDELSLIESREKETAIVKAQRITTKVEHERETTDKKVGVCGPGFGILFV